MSYEKELPKAWRQFESDRYPAVRPEGGLARRTVEATAGLLFVLLIIGVLAAMWLGVGYLLWAGLRLAGESFASVATLAKAVARHPYVASFLWVGAGAIGVSLIGRLDTPRSFRGREPWSPERFFREAFPGGEVHPSVFVKVCLIFMEQLGITLERARPEDPVKEWTGDDLDAVEIVLGLEEEFGLEIPSEDAERLDTLTDVVRYVDRRLRAAGKLPAPGDPVLG